MDGRNQFSLLAPEGQFSYYTLPDSVVNDLSLDFITKNMNLSVWEQKVILEILRQMPLDEEVIRYRQEIFQDLKSESGLGKTLLEIVFKIKGYLLENGKAFDGRSNMMALVRQLMELKYYIESILQLQACLEGKTFRSEGMRKLSQYIASIYHASGFQELSEDIAQMTEELGTVKSMTLGINFGEGLFPKEIGILGLHYKEFKDQTIVGRFIDFHRKKGEIEETESSMGKMSYSARSIYYQPYGDSDPMMVKLADLIEKMLPNAVRPIRRLIRKYADVSGVSLASLANELLFYVSFEELEKQLEAVGMPCSMPGISGDDTQLNEFYNLKLAICRMQGLMDQDVVCNPLQITRDRAVMILTGPNRGGKTMYTQGIGLAFLLFQQGVFVPCASGVMRLCDGIYTHFPVDENEAVSMGRLGEEAQRFHDICQQATSESLILMNESFATASYAESLYIAGDVLRYLCYLGARTCFSTHMIELAEHAEELGKTDNAICQAVSLVMGSGEEEYRVQFAKPKQQSYAREIASEYGITFKQLIQK